MAAPFSADASRPPTQPGQGVGGSAPLERIRQAPLHLVVTHNRGRGRPVGSALALDSAMDLYRPRHRDSAPLVQQAQPVVETLYAWSHFSLRGIWGMITSAWGSQFLHIFAEIDAQRKALPIVRQLFAGNDLAAQMPPEFYLVTSQHTTHVYHRGASCCRYYLLRRGQYCASCPLISQEERLQRQQARMKHLMSRH